MLNTSSHVLLKTFAKFFFGRTPVLGLGLGFDFTTAWDNNNNNKNKNNNDNKTPNLNF